MRTNQHTCINLFTIFFWWKPSSKDTLSMICYRARWFAFIQQPIRRITQSPKHHKWGFLFHQFTFSVFMTRNPLNTYLAFWWILIRRQGFWFYFTESLTINEVFLYHYLERNGGKKYSLWTYYIHGWLGYGCLASSFILTTTIFSWISNGGQFWWT